MHKSTILFVDDENNILKSLKRLFIDTDYKVLLASSGQEGIELFNTHNIELVISDYRMPEMNGVQFLSKIKELYPETIRIILSGYADVIAIVEAINDGEVYKFLAKPWNDQELLTTVHRAVEHYKLQKENDKLVNELQSANRVLKDLTKSLEEKVEERTRALAMKNKALMVSQKILNQLPVGVLGIDSNGMVVYMNQALNSYIDTTHIQLGFTFEPQMNAEVYNLFYKSLRDNKEYSYTLKGSSNFWAASSPTPDATGVILLFSTFNLEHFGQSIKINENSEVTSV